MNRTKKSRGIAYRCRHNLRIQAPSQVLTIDDKLHFEVPQNGIVLSERPRASQSFGLLRQSVARKVNLPVWQRDHAITFSNVI